MKRPDYISQKKRESKASLVVPIKVEDIPADHKIGIMHSSQYDRTPEYKFFAYDGDIFIRRIDDEERHNKIFLRHWTDIAGYRYDKSDDHEYDILCPCGNTKFTLKYGDYEIVATCICGRSETVYSG